MQFPAEFDAYLTETFGTETGDNLRNGLLLKRAVSFRRNPFRMSEADWEAFLTASGLPVQQVVAFPETYVVPDAFKSRITESEHWNSGGIYIQNPSSMLAAYALAPEPGEQILDLTAAPGSKTQLLSVMMRNEGRIAAVEVQRDRFFRMKQNLARCGTENAVCYHKDGTLVGRQKPEFFDRVLLDAPCSSESFIGTENEEAAATWSLKKVRATVQKQKMLAYSALQALKPGGRFVYATCTLNTLENEEMVRYLLEKFGEVLEPEPLESHLVERIPIYETAFSEQAPGALRIFPGAVWDGFFIARFRKTGRMLSD